MPRMTPPVEVRWRQRVIAKGHQVDDRRRRWWWRWWYGLKGWWLRQLRYLRESQDHRPDWKCSRCGASMAQPPEDWCCGLHAVASAGPEADLVMDVAGVVTLVAKEGEQ